MVCFTKRKKKGKKGISIEYLRYGRDETLGRVSNFLFSGFCFVRLEKAKALSFVGRGREIYALA